jgi:hypothetical protein
MTWHTFWKLETPTQKILFNAILNSKANRNSPLPRGEVPFFYRLARPTNETPGVGLLVDSDENNDTKLNIPFDEILNVQRFLSSQKDALDTKSYPLEESRKIYQEAR